MQDQRHQQHQSQEDARNEDILIYLKRRLSPGAGRLSASMTAVSCWVTESGKGLRLYDGTWPS